MRSHRLFTALAACAALLAARSALAQDATPIGSLSNSMQGQEVTISGEVTQFRASTYDRMPNRLTVTDATGSVTTVIWPDVFTQLSPAPAQGTPVTIRGEVGEYRGELQVQVDAVADVVSVGGSTPAPVASAPAAAAPVAVAGDTTPLNTISVAMDGQAVVIEGVIENIRPSGNPSAPNTLTLRDASGTGTAVIWPEVWMLLNPPPQQGQRLRGSGTVGEFRGNAQVALRDAAQITVSDASGQSLSTAPAEASAPPADSGTPAPAAAGEPVEIAVAAIDGTVIGQVVRITGSVAGVRLATSERAPNIVTLTDGTSTIPVVSWSDTWSSLPRPPAQGDRVTVIGEVSLYEQRNEIQVRLRSLTYDAP